MGVIKLTKDYKGGNMATQMTRGFQGLEPELPGVLYVLKKKSYQRAQGGFSFGRVPFWFSAVSRKYQLAQRGSLKLPRILCPRLPVFETFTT